MLTRIEVEGFKSFEDLGVNLTDRSGISAGQLTRLKADGRLAFEVR